MHSLFEIAKIVEHYALFSETINVKKKTLVHSELFARLIKRKNKPLS